MFLAFPVVCGFCWSLLRHEHWRMDWARLVIWTLAVALLIVFDLEDYFGWRNQDQPNLVTPDRDEGPASL